MNVAIAIDDWKLPVFARELEAGGITFTRNAGVTEDTLLLSVTCDAVDAQKLYDIVKNTNEWCARYSYYLGNACFLPGYCGKCLAAGRNHDGVPWCSVEVKQLPNGHGDNEPPHWCPIRIIGQTDDGCATLEPQA